MKYLKEIIILILQSAAFYLIPLFSDPYNPMGMVLLILLVTFWHCLKSQQSKCDGIMKIPLKVKKSQISY